MNTKSRQKNYNSDIIKNIKDKINNADAIIIGAGAGLSASAGLNYGDEKFFAEHYSPFLKKGYKTVGQGISDNWSLNENNAVTYWGYWANHINNIYYKPAQLDAYKALYNIIKDKNYFVITTNGDGQFFKGLYDTKKIFAMQGSYSKFQCQKNCSDKTYDNKDMINKMLDGFNPETLKIQKVDIPRCPDCGGLLCPNLRIDGYFAEGDNMENREKYVEFINDNAQKNVVFFELGVGYNTPVIIRFPFEQMTNKIDNACLIRVNKSYPQISSEIGSKAISTDMDIQELLDKIAE